MDCATTIADRCNLWRRAPSPNAERQRAARIAAATEAVERQLAARIAAAEAAVDAIHDQIPAYRRDRHAPAFAAQRQRIPELAASITDRDELVECVSAAANDVAWKGLEYLMPTRSTNMYRARHRRTGEIEEFLRPVEANNRHWEPIGAAPRSHTGGAMPALPVAMPMPNVPTSTVATAELIQRAIGIAEGRINSTAVPAQKQFTKVTAEQIIAAAAKANSPTGTDASEQQKLDPRAALILAAHRKAKGEA